MDISITYHFAALERKQPRLVSNTLYPYKMEYILKFSEFEKYFEKVAFTEVKVFEGQATLRKFIASMLSYYPWWIVQLYCIRKLLVSILGLVKHKEPEKLPNLQPEVVSFTPGLQGRCFVVAL